MSAIAIGNPVPDIELPATGEKSIKLADYRGKPVVLYFYPKASTPGCTREGLDFSAAAAKFRRQSAVILGVSRDGVKAQENFKHKQGFPFHLLSDKDELLCQAFDVIKMKSMYGKQVRGIERSTFLIDEAGLLRHEWRKVKVEGHVETVLETLKAMRAGKLP
ncbi:MAG: peroxiredoxin [Candidatus Thiodiazotropha sp. (ex Epidulcina cf. delphinae)]|nr:peroxiredoxin [Candidatus Thiodiazotropha sp. (ex Epidulcina cf. delphinae)]